MKQSCLSPARLRRLQFASLSVAVTTLLCAARLEGALTISPSTIANDYTGPVNLTITGLDSAGQTVVVEEFSDGDGSGTITAGDTLLRKFNVTDGQVTTIAGVRNLNIPGDEDGAANGQIQTRLLYSANDLLARIDGGHIFRVSPSGAGFAPLTASFPVTQRDYAGSGISGTVVGGSPTTGQPGALVLVQTAGSDGDSFALTIAGSGGAFSIKVPAGRYQIIAGRPGFVFNFGTSPVLTVPVGSFVTGQTETLVTSARTISGKIRDTATLAGLPAIVMEGFSQTGFVAIAAGDASGNYVMDATAEPWQVNLDETGVSRSGYLGKKTIEPSTVSVTGFNIDLPRATSLIFGTMKTPANVPVPFTQVGGNTNGSPSLKSSATTDANGDYSLGAIPTAWEVRARPAGYLVQSNTVVVNANGSAVLQNLVAHPVTAHLRGQIRDNHNTPVGNVGILARDPNAAPGNEINAYATTDANGNFDLGVYGGGGTATQPWQLQLNQNSSTQIYISTTPEFQVQDGVDINGINYVVYLVTAHLRGQVLDENNAPIANIAVYAATNTGLLNGTNTDAGGNFDVGVFAGTWQLGLSNITGLGLIPQNYSTVVVDGMDQNNIIFRARHTNATISASLRNGSNAPISGVSMLAVATLNGASYASSATTDASGIAALPVFSANWTVSADANGLTAQGYGPVANQSVFVNSGTFPLNFVAGPIATVVSRKLHGGVPFDINLPLTGNPGIECRGGTGNHQFLLTFPRAVTFGGASVTAGTGTVASASGGGSATLTVNLTGVTNAQRLVLTLANVNDGTSTFNVALPIGILLGDANGDGVVNSGDATITRGRSGQPTDGTNFRSDYNLDGIINAGDATIVRSRSGGFIP